MKILYVIAMYGGEYLGNLIHRELGHEFQKRGHTFDVFALAAARELRGRANDVAEEGILVHRATAAGTRVTNGLNALTKPLFHYDRFATGWLALRKYLAGRPPYDLMLTEGAYPFGAMGALANRKAKLVITAAGGDFIDSRAASYGYGRYRSARALMRYAFQHAAAVRVTTPLVRDRVIALGATPAQVAVIPRNIAAYCYPPADLPLAAYRAAARRTLAARYGTGDAHLVAAVGRLLPIKGFDTLISALPALIEKVGDTRILLAGPNRVDPKLGDYQKVLAALAGAQGVADKIVFTGAVEHPAMREILAAADVIAVPSLLEGMNKVAVEGAAVGTPSVVTRTSGIADLLQEAHAGEIVEAGSSAALAEGLAQVLCDEPRRAGYIRNGLGFAQAFSSAAIGAQFVSLCEAVR